MDGVTEYLRDHAYRQHFACRARVFQTISLAEPGAEPTASVEALHRDVLILGVERLGSFAELEGRFIALVHSTDDRNWQKDEGTATVH